MRDEPSKSAMRTALSRARHRLEDDRPWVLDDPFALSLIGPEWRRLRDVADQAFHPALRRQVSAGVVVRSRFTEDRLVGGGFRQYVILGAGLDSFVWRRPDLLRGGLVTFEVDHPATQRWKRERAAALSLPDDEHLVYAACDFERETLGDALAAAGFDTSRPTLFSWLGVSMYLSVDAVASTLRTIATGAPGTEIVFTYAPPPEELDDLGREFLDAVQPALAMQGERFATFFTATDVDDLVERCGLAVVARPSREELDDRYFAGRADGVRVWSVERIVVAATRASAV
jgi:methyltransferase (TIGR00027 family)